MANWILRPLFHPDSLGEDIPQNLISNLFKKNQHADNQVVIRVQIQTAPSKFPIPEVNGSAWRKHCQRVTRYLSIVIQKENSTSSGLPGRLQSCCLETMVLKINIARVCFVKIIVDNSRNLDKSILYRSLLNANTDEARTEQGKGRVENIPNRNNTTRTRFLKRTPIRKERLLYSRAV